MTTTIALGIEYDGSPFSGWQRQQHVDSVQQQLERALSRVADQPITLFCAGRTDAGVHATGQVVHFTTTAQRPIAAWIMGGNAHLPNSIAVCWAKVVDDDFHARFSATARRYRYIIINSRHRPAILARGITHIHLPLDQQKMHRAGQWLVGEHDFSAFRAQQCQSKSPWRCIHHLRVAQLGQYIVVDIKANAFVHHMVRNIVGSLVTVGSGQQDEHYLARLLAGKDRTLAAATAKANGLYLVSVDYPARFAIPQRPLGPLFLPHVDNLG